MARRRSLPALSGALPLRRRHFTIFVVITSFALAQLTWWVYFQVREGERFAHAQRKIWAQQIELARQHRAGFALESPQFSPWLQNSFPDLETSPGVADLRVKQTARQRLDHEAGGRVRMFVAEGLFFSLLLLLSVLYMYRTLKTELAVEQRQSVFIAATSHELKTPITSLRLYLDTMIERDLKPEQRRELLAIMGQDVSRLNDLIESLLHAQALMKESARRALQAVDLSEETQLAVQEMQGRFDPVRHPLSVDLDFGLTAMADPERWRLIVKNLLDNAHKYSPGGGMIDVRLERIHGTAKLTITDQGIGFPPEEAEHIFERFYRIGSEDTRRTHGTGLGLFLVREISRSFGGRSYASSPGPGGGAVFIVEIPLVKENPNA